MKIEKLQSLKYFTGLDTSEAAKNSAKWLLNFVTHADLNEFLQTTYKFKREAVEALLSDPSAVARFARKFTDLVCFHPQEVEEILGCTKTERQRWTKEGKLAVCGQGWFYKWRSDQSYDLFDPFQILSLTPRTLESWRSEHKSKRLRDRKLAAKKARKTREHNDSKRAEFQDSYQSLLATWEKTDSNAVPYLELAYWTTWVNRWAKEYQLKAVRATRKGYDYEDRFDSLYDLKNDAIRILAKCPYAKLSFYRPAQPDRIIYSRERYEDYFDWDLDYDFVTRTRQVAVGKHKDYYSLYFLEIFHPNLPEIFSFHTPYPLGKYWLPAANTLTQVQHREQEGIFRFGRSLFDFEKIIHTEKLTVSQYQRCYQRLTPEKVNTDKEHWTARSTWCDRIL